MGKRNKKSKRGKSEESKPLLALKAFHRLAIIVASAIIGGIAWQTFPHFLSGPSVQATYTLIDQGPCYSVEINSGPRNEFLDRLVLSIQIPEEDIQYVVTANTIDLGKFTLAEPIMVGVSNGRCFFVWASSPLPPNVQASMSRGVPKTIEVQASQFTGLVSEMVLITKTRQFDEVLGKLGDRAIVLDGRYRFSKWGVNVDRKLVFTERKQVANPSKP